MNRKQRNLVDKGIDEMNAEDDAVRVCLRAEPVKKWTMGNLGRFLCLLPMMAAASLTGAQAIPVSTASQVTAAGRFIDSMNPDVVFSYLDPRYVILYKYRDI